MSISRAFSAILLATLVACGGDDPQTLKNDAFKAMDSGDAAGAVSKFEQALAGTEESAPDYIEIAVGRCQALALVDGEKSEAEFTTLAAKPDLAVTDKDYSAVVSSMVKAKSFVPAINTCDAGIKRFPDSQRLKDLMDKVIVASKKAGNKKALGALDGLGYLGD